MGDQATGVCRTCGDPLYDRRRRYCLAHAKSAYLERDRSRKAKKGQWRGYDPHEPKSAIIRYAVEVTEDRDNDEEWIDPSPGGHGPYQERSRWNHLGGSNLGSSLERTDDGDPDFEREGKKVRKELERLGLNKSRG